MPRGDQPTTVAAAIRFGWVYEDDLPEISQAMYDAWYAESLVLGGVRMGPSLAQVKIHELVKAGRDALVALKVANVGGESLFASDITRALEAAINLAEGK